MVIEPFCFLFKGRSIFRGQPAEYGEGGGGGVFSGVGLLAFCRLAHHYSSGGGGGGMTALMCFRS